MKKRLKKKAGRAGRKEIHALLDTALDINGLLPRQRRKTGELPTVFISFSGHVGKLSLDVHSRGWEPDEYPDFKAGGYISDSHMLHGINKELKAKYLK